MFPGMQGSGKKRSQRDHPWGQMTTRQRTFHLTKVDNRNKKRLQTEAEHWSRWTKGLPMVLRSASRNPLFV